MKTYILFLTLASFVLINYSCQQATDSYSDMINELYGSWVLSEYEQNIIVFTRSENLLADEYSFSIKSNSVFIEHKQSGCCGNSPDKFANFNGNWKKLSENMLQITIDNIDWTEIYEMEVVSLSSSQAKILYHY